MKKTLLLAAGLMLAGSAMAQVNEPTLTLDWTITDNMPASTNARWGAAYGGKFYLNEKTVGFYSYSAENGTKTTIEGVKVDGTGFNFDGVGNALFTNYFPGTSGECMKNLVLWKASTGTTSILTISDEDLTSLGYVGARMDFIGRGVGDIFSATGGAFFFANGTDTEGAKKILKVYITNGELDMTKTKVLDAPASADNGTIVIPMTNDPASDDVVFRYRSNYNGKYGQFQYHNGTKWVAYTDASTKPSATSGGDIIMLDGMLFTIEPTGSNYYDGWQIVERNTNTVVASVAESSGTQYKNATSYGTVLTAEKVSENVANIYHYHHGLYIKKYTFETPKDYLTAIEEVEADANAPVEYYNLQGVKVANPEKGLFIKKQGNKATKVVL